jgi:type I restriction enzyme S subunit
MINGIVGSKTPSGWRHSRLKYLARFQAGEHITAESIRPEGDFPVYGGNGLRGFTDSYSHEGDVILVGRQGALCGNVNYTSGKFWASEHAVVVSPAPGIDVRWFGELLYSMDLRQYSMTAAQPGLSVEYVVNLPVLVPPLESQRRIAVYLDRELGRIDALIAAKVRWLTLLDEKRQTLITHAVTRGLSPDVPYRDSGLPWLGEMPEHWEVVRLKYLTSKIGSGKTPSGGAEAYVSSGIPLIRSQNVRFEGLSLEDVVFIDEQTDESMSNSRVLVDDVLLNITGASIGRCCRMIPSACPANVNQHVCILRPKPDQITPEFLNLLLSCEIGQRQVFTGEEGISREGLNFEDLGDFLLTVPPVSEQKLIVNHCEAHSQKFDTLRDRTKESLNLLRERRSALITAVVTGKLEKT